MARWMRTENGRLINVENVAYFFLEKANSRDATTGEETKVVAVTAVFNAPGVTAWLIVCPDGTVAGECMDKLDAVLISPNADPNRLDLRAEEWDKFRHRQYRRDAS